MSIKKVIYTIVLDAKTKNGRGEYMLKIKATLNGRSISFPTNIFVHKYQFEDEVVIEHPQAKQLNAMLNKYIMEMQSMELEAFKRDMDLTIQNLCTIYCEKVTADTPLIDFNDHVMKYCTNRREITKRKYYDIVKLIDEFHPGVCLEDIDIIWLKKYEKHMLAKGNQPSSIGSTMKCIRALFNEAIKRGIISRDKNPFNLYSISEIRSRSDVLMYSEIEELELYGLKSPVDRHVRDIFCFACYTGLRWSDLKKLKKENFNTTNGVTWLKIKTQKTGSIVQMPISVIFFGNAMRIMEKYESIEQLCSYGSNSSINRALKELIDKIRVGNGQRITMHTARRSFITALADFGVPIATIQKLAGHARITTTSKYLQLSVGMIKKDIDKSFCGGTDYKIIHIETPKREILRKSLTGKDLVIGSEFLKCRNCSFCEEYYCHLFHKDKNIDNDWCDSFSERLNGEPYKYSESVKKRDDNHTAKFKVQAKKRQERELEKVKENLEDENRINILDLDVSYDKEEYKKQIYSITETEVKNEDELLVTLAECELV